MIPANLQRHFPAHPYLTLRIHRFPQEPRKHQRNPHGLDVLFAGPAGTGRTMAAQVLARESGLDLYRVDLSSVVGKYVGETEKNLNRIFDEAETSNALLFFEEADALFGKRSGVKGAHDRYADSNTTYLFERIKSYSGIVILATNIETDLDEDIARRCNLTNHFP